MTILGLGSYGVAWAIGVPGYEQPAAPMDAFAFLKFADELGLRLVQIADNLPLHTFSDDQLRAVRDEAARRNIAVEVGARGIQTEFLRRYIQIAQLFNSPILRVVVDTKEHHPSPEEVVSLIRAVLPELEAAGITLAIENHDRFKARTLADIIEALDSPHAGICLDTVNSFGALEGSEVVVDTLGPYVVNLHLKEFVVKRAGHAMGFEITGRPTGQGMMNVPWLLDKLYGFGRTFNAIIEAWLPMQITIEETVAIEARWAREGVAYLRQFIKD
ncbi:MAG: sugar phosphate isomerase/epimerase [Chloroflexi bacterium]|nr:sugar phosphate isomerase/epimerase [Chloroflexota bacterium]